MKQRGRKSLSPISVVAGVSEIPRLPPPPELSEFEAHVWTATVNTKPADWFQADTLPLLLSYCKHVSQSYTIDAEIAQFDPAWLRDESGLKRYQVLTHMRERESRAMTALARSMRLTQQARWDHQKSNTLAKKAVTKRPWEG